MTRTRAQELKGSVGGRGRGKRGKATAVSTETKDEDMTESKDTDIVSTILTATGNSQPSKMNRTRRSVRVPQATAGKRVVSSSIRRRMANVRAKLKNNPSASAKGHTQAHTQGNGGKSTNSVARTKKAKAKAQSSTSNTGCSWRKLTVDRTNTKRHAEPPAKHKVKAQHSKPSSMPSWRRVLLRIKEEAPKNKAMQKPRKTRLCKRKVCVL